MELLTRKFMDILEEFAFMILAVSRCKPGCDWLGDGIDGVFFSKKCSSRSCLETFWRRLLA